jgi:hypothetical protein
MENNRSKGGKKRESHILSRELLSSEQGAARAGRISHPLLVQLLELSHMDRMLPILDIVNTLLAREVRFRHGLLGFSMGQLDVGRAARSNLR